jgi:hypothetical protein
MTSLFINVWLNDYTYIWKFNAVHYYFVILLTKYITIYCSKTICSNKNTKSKKQMETITKPKRLADFRQTKLVLLYQETRNQA